MKPALFEYLRPESVDAALAMLARHPDAAVLAGGQSLVPMLGMRLASPSHLVDISRISELAGVAAGKGGLRLGTLVRHGVLETAPAVAEAAPMLRAAAEQLAHPAIRNRGTIGGSLALADPAAELPACVMALDGTIEAAGPNGRREIPAATFCLGAFETVLGPGELLTAVTIPPPPTGFRYAYEKLARRHGDYALAGLAACGRFDGGRPSGLRLVFFGVGDRPVHAAGAAARLEAGEAVEAAVESLAGDLEPTGQPRTGAGTKLHLAGVLLRRAWARLAT